MKIRLKPGGNNIDPEGRRQKVIFAASFGNALEFFDFGIYNFFVIYISVLFFPPSSDPHLALLLAFATFGVSFFMRPLGGILISAYAVAMAQAGDDPDDFLDERARR